VFDYIKSSTNPYDFYKPFSAISVSLLQLALFHLYPLVPLTGPDHQFFHVSNVIFGVYCKIIALHLEHKFDQGSQVLIAILI
jgi:hypothetical protein